MGLTRRFLKILWIYARYDLPLWFVSILTNWWPDNQITIRLRGMLYKPFIFRCGKNFTVAKWVQLKSTHKLTIGDNVYFATGVCHTPCYFIRQPGDVSYIDQVPLRQQLQDPARI